MLHDLFLTIYQSVKNWLQIIICSAFGFCRFCVDIFLSPPQLPLTSNFEGVSIPDCIHYNYFPLLILGKEPVFPFLMFSAKQENTLVLNDITKSRRSATCNSYNL